MGSLAARWFAFIAAWLAVIFAGAWLHDDSGLRTAVDIAGDDGLPGAKLMPDWEATRRFAERLGAERDAYLQFLSLDNGFVALAAVAFVCTAWLTARASSRLLPLALVGASVAYALADWSENWLLARAVAAAASDPAPYVRASLATTLKWGFAAAAVALAAVQLARFVGPRAPWRLALFHDVPYFVERGWRRLEFGAHREFTGAQTRPGLPDALPFWRVLPFWLSSATALFVCFGPSLSGFCSAAPAAAPWGLGLLGLALLGAIGWTLARAVSWARGLLGAHDFAGAPQDTPYEGKRRWITTIVLGGCVALFLSPLWLASGAALFGALQDPCEGAAFSPTSLARLALFAVAMASFAVAWRRQPSTPWLMAWQAATLAFVFLAHWFWLTARPGANEASGDPYRHVFAVVAPATLAALCLVPWLARRLIGRSLAKHGAEFRAALGQRELFKPEEMAPLPTSGAVWHALLFGVTYRWLQFALIPSLVTLVAPVDWLYWLAGFGLALSIGFSAWGNLFARWQQMPMLVERWLLSGTAYFVSLFVVAVAACRLAGVSYVTTLLDGAPFGVIFTGAVMCYALSWLVEYWTNRAAGAQLLALLGNEGKRTAMGLPQAAGGQIAYHGLGRFLVQRQNPGEPAPAVHTYAMTELFGELAGAGKAALAAEVSRQVHLYFYLVNLLVAAIALFFAGLYWHSYTSARPDALVSAEASVDQRKLNDLADRLLAAPGDARPAIVVIASGGGTRAAVWAQHVLEGLHSLGADRDIVLTSGVSGGGVALAYFALHYPKLADPRAHPIVWQRFREAAEGNYIEDVMRGASEWRIYRTAPLSVLLAETFERRLFAKGDREPTFDLPGTPALILNTTITGHPDTDSALLTMALNRAADGDCEEIARPYKLMQGGRLIFTNLRQVNAFPGRGEPIPDVRLPYAIVRDPNVRLASAAALNANFPPVFPNALVQVRNQDPEASCGHRSYLVTDGGAEENLGLVSALFAVQSALNEIGDRCSGKAARSDKWCARRLRRIHFVIAEASATGYDYEQDRGISAGLEGAKDRMTGELTNRLIADANASYLESPAAPARAREMAFHFLAMPLVFRSRGGVGTHWTHAEHFTFADPRQRASNRWLASTVALDWQDLRRMWRSLHAPDLRFCGDDSYGGIDTDTVRRWICGGRFDANKPRDLHILEWRALVGELGPAPGATRTP